MRCELMALWGRGASDKGVLGPQPAHKDEKVDVGPTRLLAGHTAAAHKGKPRAGLLWATALCGSTNTLCVQKANVRCVEKAVRARL